MENNRYFDSYLPKLKEEVLKDTTRTLKFCFEEHYNEDYSSAVFTTEEIVTIREVYKSEYNRRMDMEIPKCFEIKKTTVLGTNNIFITVLDRFIHHYTGMKMYYIRQEHETESSYTTYETVTHEKMVDILLSID